jgi:hypothetical protein
VKGARISGVIADKKVLIFLLIANGWGAEVTTRPALSYSKLIGGSGSDLGMAVATDSAGNVYLAGTTTSHDFPIVNAYQRKIGETPFRASIDGGRTWATQGISEPLYAVS